MVEQLELQIARRTAAVGVRTLAGVILASAARWPEKVACRFPETELTYGELERDALTIAQGLRALGVRPGDHVGLLLPNGTDFIRSYFGVALASAVVVPFNTRYRRNDLSYVIAKSDVKVLILSAESRSHFDFEGLIRDLRSTDAFSMLQHVVVLSSDEAGDFISERVFRDGAAREPVEAVLKSASLVRLDSPCALLFSSGTTAFPKGCLLSHETIVRGALTWGEGLIGMNERDSVWIPNPLFHIGALTTLTASVATGARFMSLPYFDADMAVDMLSTNAATLFFPVFEAVAMPVIDHPHADRVRFEDVRYAFTLGSPVNVDRVRRAIPHARHLNVYGSTETSGFCIFNLDTREAPSSCGLPMPGVELKIVPFQDAGAAEDTKIGEMCIRSWCTLTEYYKDPAANETAFDSEGWFHTGDAGWVDDQGRVYFSGRKGEFLKVGGENVSPREIEMHIGSHEAVRQVAVIGIPDSRMGEVPAAYVELRSGFCLEETDLLAFCRDSIARFKQPRHIRFVDTADWPMSATKIKKSELRERLIAELTKMGQLG